MNPTITEHLFDIQDKVVIITGGLGQLGRQFALALTRLGAKVAIFDNKARKQGGPKNRFRDGARLKLFPIDITRKSSVISGLGRLNRVWGVPHALINNAAIDSPPNSSSKESGPFERYPEKSWDKVIDVNLKGVFLACQIIGTQMAQAERGSIINTGSIYGLVSPDQRIYQHRSKNGNPFFKPVAYSASKSGLLNLTRYLATYWAKKNVRVNTLTLGGVLNHQDPKFLKGYAQRVPIGRMAREDEYNGAVIFLVSDASSYMTGSNLVIDGGWTTW